MINIIALVILAVIIGASGWQGMEDYGKSFSGVVRAISELPKGIP